ncbi:hypothetical protein [Haloarchaeobius sp. HRN-SO-5]|uniref:hypothetical protein n=1 Tax=Haloarchaeobius sp. HRN-SO-5 TaxID=3446118 RepID=UPI003EC09962
MSENDNFDIPDETRGQEAEEGSSMLNLVDAWDSSREPFDEWVQSVSRAYYESEFGIESAAKLLDTSSGELAAVLNLATMEDEALELLAEDVPPKTTWFTFAGASVGEIEAGLDALEEMSEDESPHSVVKTAVLEVRGPTPEQQVSELPGEVFFHLSTKAKQYELLSGKARKFLYQMGMVRSNDGEMSPKQADWAHDLLEEMADQGAIKRESPDDDQEICNQVLDALGW